jgi:SAM-dependent methyltransferase
MDLERLKRDWDALGQTDPLWAVLSIPGKEGSRWDVEEFFAWGRDEIDGVLRYLESLELEVSRRTALDFGCGVGRLTQALAVHFEAVHGVDIAPSMIGLARRYNRYPERCTYHLNDREELAIFGDGTFDLIYSNITLQHMEPRFARGYLRELLRVLAPQGVLVFQLPSRPTKEALKETRPRKRLAKLLWGMIPAPLRGLHRRLRSPEAPVRQLYGIPRHRVIRLLEEHGGTVIDVQSDAWAPGWVGFRYCVTKQ